MNELTPYLRYSLLISCVIFGCGLPTDYEAKIFSVRTPDEVVANLSQAYQEKNVERYLSSLSGDCRFSDGGEYLWGKTQEQKIHQRLFAAAKLNHHQCRPKWPTSDFVMDRQHRARSQQLQNLSRLPRIKNRSDQLEFDSNRDGHYYNLDRPRGNHRYGCSIQRALSNNRSG